MGKPRHETLREFAEDYLYETRFATTSMVRRGYEAAAGRSPWNPDKQTARLPRYAYSTEIRSALKRLADRGVIVEVPWSGGNNGGHWWVYTGFPMLAPQALMDFARFMFEGRHVE